MYIFDNKKKTSITVSTTTLGSSLGTGGMETKLIAAEIATAAGVTTIITSSKDPSCIFRIIEYDMQIRPREFRSTTKCKFRKAKIGVVGGLAKPAT